MFISDLGGHISVAKIRGGWYLGSSRGYYALMIHKMYMFKTHFADKRKQIDFRQRHLCPYLYNFTLLSVELSENWKKRRLSLILLGHQKIMP